MRTFKQIAREAAQRSAPMTVITAVYRDQTDKQIAVWEGAMVEKRDDSTGELREVEKWVWLPKPQVSATGANAGDDIVPTPVSVLTLTPGTAYKFHIPEWLAEDRGLL